MGMQVGRYGTRQITSFSRITIYPLIASPITGGWDYFPFLFFFQRKPELSEVAQYVYVLRLKQGKGGWIFVPPSPQDTNYPRDFSFGKGSLWGAVTVWAALPPLPCCFFGGNKKIFFLISASIILCKLEACLLTCRRWQFADGGTGSANERGKTRTAIIWETFLWFFLRKMVGQDKVASTEKLNPFHIIRKAFFMTWKLEGYENVECLLHIYSC